jgi:hypothetical protein
MADQTSVTYTVENLEPCSQYRFSVYAQNPGGEGQGDDTEEDTTVAGKQSSVY